MYAPLNYKKYGAGEPVIILHGVFGMLDNWHSAANSLSKSFTVYTVDQRNHGLSPHSSSHTYPELAEDLKDFLAFHKIKSAHIVGHSMGGSVAMKFASLYPERVNKIVVVDIAPKKYSEKHDKIFDAVCSLKLEDFTKRRDIDNELAGTLTEPRVRQFIMKNITRSRDDKFHWKLNLKTLREYYDHIIAGPGIEEPVAKPVLFIKGERSAYIANGDFEHIRNLFPEAEIVTIKEAGHWVHVEAPGEFVRLVKQFLL